MSTLPLALRRFVALLVALAVRAFVANNHALQRHLGAKATFWVGIGVMAGVLALMWLLLRIPLRRRSAPRE